MRRVLLRRCVLAFAIASSFELATAEDVTVTPPNGGGFIVTSGTFTIGGLPGAAQQTAPLCFNAVSGALGPCSAGSTQGTPGPTGPVGPAGPGGPTGPAGLNGQQGNAGPTGATGVGGPIGATGPAGPTGSIGPVGATGPAGLSIVFRGAWSDAMQYITGDSVSFNGSSYTALGGTSGQQPDLNPASWGLLAQAGVTGALGPTGAAGNDSGVAFAASVLSPGPGFGAFYFAPNASGDPTYGGNWTQFDQVSVPMPVACTFDALYLILSAVPEGLGGGGSISVTLIVNGTASTLSATADNSSGKATASASGAVAVAVGDEVALEASGDGIDAGQETVRASLHCQPGVAGSTGPTGPTGSTGQTGPTGPTNP